MSDACSTASSITSDMAMPCRVLIIGAGLTGSLTAAILRRQLTNVDVTIWEKSRGAGGRMTTSRSPGIHGGRADTGAQYISATPHFYSSHSSFYQELLSSKTLAPFSGVIEGEKKQDGVKHFVAPDGTSAVVKYFLHQSKAKVFYETHCTDLSHASPLGTTGSPTQWQCTDMDGKTSLFDSVIVTIPVPQLLGLKGTIQDVIQERRSLLENVQYSSRYAIAMFYDPGVKISLPWTAKYVTENPCIRFACVDTKKRGQDTTDDVTSLVLHTSVPFGIQYLESDRQEVEGIIVKHATELFPDLPQPSSIKCQKWRYSQVSTPFHGSPGCLLLSNTPLLIAGGDAFVHSNFDGCVESALTIVQNFVKCKM